MMILNIAQNQPWWTNRWWWRRWQLKWQFQWCWQCWQWYPGVCRWLNSWSAGRQLVSARAMTPDHHCGDFGYDGDDNHDDDRDGDGFWRWFLQLIKQMTLMIKVIKMKWFLDIPPRERPLLQETPKCWPEISTIFSKQFIIHQFIIAWLGYMLMGVGCALGCCLFQTCIPPCPPPSLYGKCP